MIYENKKYAHFLAAFIVVIFLNLLIKSLILSFICASLFLIISLKRVVQFSNKNAKIDNEIRRQALIFNGAVFIISILWFIFNIVAFLVVTALLQVIKGLIIWGISLIK